MQSYRKPDDTIRQTTMDYNEYSFYRSSKAFIKSILFNNYKSKEEKENILIKFIQITGDKFVEQEMYNYVQRLQEIQAKYSGYESIDLERFYPGDSVPSNQKSKQELDQEMDEYRGKDPRKMAKKIEEIRNRIHIIKEKINEKKQKTINEFFSKKFVPRLSAPEFIPKCPMTIKVAKDLKIISTDVITENTDKSRTDESDHWKRNIEDVKNLKITLKKTTNGHFYLKPNSEFIPKKWTCRRCYHFENTGEKCDNCLAEKGLPIKPWIERKLIANLSRLRARRVIKKYNLFSKTKTDDADRVSQGIQMLNNIEKKLFDPFKPLNEISREKPNTFGRGMETVEYDLTVVGKHVDFETIDRIDRNVSKFSIPKDEPEFAIPAIILESSDGFLPRTNTPMPHIIDKEILLTPKEKEVVVDYLSNSIEDDMLYDNSDSSDMSEEFEFIKLP